ncbi:Endonuclease [Achlya hypogyna]|uniref:Endonuclease n=1 Tax=Achlya hypogyna TaxID=1202772 RepID=A0A1V9YJW0_ACHHY|nr:Endonuclease [Achlya hypogyna]
MVPLQRPQCVDCLILHRRILLTAALMRLRGLLRERSFIHSPSLLCDQTEAPWYHFYMRRDVPSFISLLSLTPAAFDALLSVFANFYVVVSGPGRRGRPSRIPRLHCVLGLLLTYHTTPTEQKLMCKSFAVAPSTLSRVIKNAEAALSQALRQIAKVAAATPSPARLNAPTALSVVTLNVNSFGPKYHSLIPLYSQRHDIAAARFCWSQLAYTDELWFECDPRFPTRPGSESCRGVVTTVSPDTGIEGLTLASPSPLPDALANRYVVVRGLLQGRPIYLHNIYAPSAAVERASFFRALPRAYEDDAIHIVGGDLNLALCDRMDAARPSVATQTGRPELLDWLACLELGDVFRMTHPTRRVFTSPRCMHRLDYIFMSRTLVDGHKVEAYHDHGQTRSDHSACVVTLSPKKSQRKGPWEPPGWLLRTPEAQAIVHSLLDGFLERTQLTTNVAKLAAAILELQDGVTDARLDAVRAIRAELKRYHAQVREFKAEASLHRHLAEAERCTRRHLRPPVPWQLRKRAITAMSDDDGVRRTSATAIASTLHAFYSGLYAADAPASIEALDAFLTPLLPPPLPPGLAASLAVPVLASEFYAAIMASAPDKTPGPNALSNAVLRLAPNKWAQAFEMVFTHRLLDHASLTKAQRMGTTILIHKKGDHDRAGNYRPISLLNTDVKMLTKALATRVQPCAQALVHVDQNGFVHGRSILANIGRLEDKLFYMKRHAPSAVITMLDFEKAFDRVCHSYLLSLLPRLGFPAAFVETVRCLYNSRQSRLLVNGQLSDSFVIGRSVLQGEPLSQLLFVLAMEPLFHTTSYFGDDTQIFARDEAALRKQLDLVESFCALSGFRLNRAKTELLTYGSLAPDLQPLVVSANAPSKSLGIVVAPDLPRQA